MKQLIDVVNFNADASCLPADEWLRCLKGGPQSRFRQWLSLYVDNQKPIVLGLTGATIAELSAFSPGAIEFIDGHPEIFQLVLRPFAHDIALLRTRDGFLLNAGYGVKTVYRHFRNVAPYFLPPEFMLTNEQVDLLGTLGVEGVFINKTRFDGSVRGSIPDRCYRLSGIVGPGLWCFPVEGELTSAYLKAIDTFETDRWVRTIRNHDLESLMSWRDGESAFLFAERLSREKHWLQTEPSDIVRGHIKFEEARCLESPCLSYPMHACGAWMREFRMLGYVGRVRAIEERLMRLTAETRRAWVLAINSDILSAIEKPVPRVTWRTSDGGACEQREIPRTTRGVEGELFLFLLEQRIRGEDMPSEERLIDRPEYKRWVARMGYLARLDEEAGALSDKLRYLSQPTS